MNVLVWKNYDILVMSGGYDLLPRRLAEVSQCNLPTGIMTLSLMRQVQISRSR